MSDASATDARARLESEHTKLLVTRIRSGLWMLIAGRLGMALTDLRVQSTARVSLLAIGIAVCTALGVALVMLRSCGSRRRAIAIALVATTTMWTTAAVTQGLRQDSTTLLPLLMVLTMGAALLIPWGAGPQLVTVLTAELSILGQ